MEAYFIHLDVGIFLSLEYNVYDESNEKSKKIILTTLLDHDVAIVRHYKTTKEIMEKFPYMCGRDESYISKIIEERHPILEERNLS